jgi:hypothetical protein
MTLELKEDPPEMRHRQHLPVQRRHHVHQERRATHLVHPATDSAEESMQCLSCLHDEISRRWCDYQSGKSSNIR